MLLFAVLLGTLAVVAVNLGTGRPWASHVGLFGGGLGLVFDLAHLGVRWWAPAADPLLLPLAAVFNGVGLALIYRLDIAYAAQAQALQHPAPRGAASLQLVWTGIGLLLFGALCWWWSMATSCCGATPTAPPWPGWACCSCRLYCRPDSARSTAPSCGSGSAGSASSRARSPRSCWWSSVLVRLPRHLRGLLRPRLGTARRGHPRSAADSAVLTEHRRLTRAMSSPVPDSDVARIRRYEEDRVPERARHQVRNDVVVGCSTRIWRRSTESIIPTCLARAEAEDRSRRQWLTAGAQPARLLRTGGPATLVACPRMPSTRTATPRPTRRGTPLRPGTSQRNRLSRPLSSRRGSRRRPREAPHLRHHQSPGPHRGRTVSRRGGGARSVRRPWSPLPSAAAPPGRP